MLKVIKLGALWCQPCRMLDPIFKVVAAAYKDVEFEIVNVDDNPELSNKYKVVSIPTILFFKDGQLVNTMVGLQKEQALRAAIETLRSIK